MFLVAGMVLCRAKEDEEGQEEIRKCLVTGFFLNTARRQHDGTYKTLADNQIVNIHPSSVLHGQKPDCVLYNELVLTSKQYIRGVSQVEVSWLPELVPQFFASSAASSGVQA